MKQSDNLKLFCIKIKQLNFLEDLPNLEKENLKAR